MSEEVACVCCCHLGPFFCADCVVKGEADEE